MSIFVSEEAELWDSSPWQNKTSVQRQPSSLVTQDLLPQEGLMDHSKSIVGSEKSCILSLQCSVCFLENIMMNRVHEDEFIREKCSATS